MIQREESLGLLKGVAVSRHGPRVSHLLFADDTLLFVQTTQEALQCIRRTLHKFEEVSGLAINWQKSALVFSKNVEAAAREDLGRVRGVTIVEKHEKYLGLPTVMGRSKRAIFEHIEERVWSKLQHWRSKFLSQAGRSVLLKAVVQAVPSSVMSVFRIPDTLLGELETRNVIEAGSRWSIGAGQQVRIMENRWLLRPKTFQPTASLVEWRRGATVSCLMNERGDNWNAELVCALFPPHNSESILAVPIRGPGEVSQGMPSLALDLIRFLEGFSALAIMFFNVSSSCLYYSQYALKGMVSLAKRDNVKANSKGVPAMALRRISQFGV
ncbi:UNVERIFIED_CONTAM: hypothetical protein Slati_3519700 [Sesamum latifolium]|uniref:Reverse transcriptase domain-containing protein n=1 Tax=Sesamum latifolium TaxID=2727402 RepID=A0AAW2UIB6_9LAMI